MKRDEPARHYRRFLTKWSQMASFAKESVNVVISPHMDDVFLSLYRHIVSGSLGSNIVGINIFSLTDSRVDTNTGTSFRSVRATSLERMKEEIAFSDHLADKGIDYIPAFVGVKDAALYSYYQFIASRHIGKLGAVARKPYDRYIAARYAKIGIDSIIQPILKQYGRSVANIVVPLGIGDHIDHMMLRRSTIKAEAPRLGMFCDMPYTYQYGFDTVEKLRAAAPTGYNEYTVRKGDAAQKARAFARLFPSQSDRKTERLILGAERATGEVVFWYNL
ncbi:MAG: hypothetical protein KGH98_01295 [Candidatus Micrarchaeota archaeon]|nr:hypothetical protein [Candidatus Micrarchaeota archaeon]